MRDLQFSNSLTSHRFARDYFNNYQFHGFIATPIIITPETAKNIPFIYYGHSVHRRDDHKIKYSNSAQFNNMRVTKEKALEILETSPVPLKINYNGTLYLMGKAFIAEFNERGEVVPLMVGTVDRKDDVAQFSKRDITFYVAAHTQNNKEKRNIQVLISIYLQDHIGDIIVTPDIYKHIGERIRLPHFNTLSEKKAYIDDMIRFCLMLEKEPETLIVT